MLPFRFLIRDRDSVVVEILVDDGVACLARECGAVQDSEIIVGSEIVGKVTVCGIRVSVNCWRTITVLL